MIKEKCIKQKENGKGLLTVLELTDAESEDYSRLMHFRTAKQTFNETKEKLELCGEATIGFERGVEQQFMKIFKAYAHCFPTPKQIYINGAFDSPAEREPNCVTVYYKETTIFKNSAHSGYSSYSYMPKIDFKISRESSTIECEAMLLQDHFWTTHVITDALQLLYPSTHSDNETAVQKHYKKETGRHYLSIAPLFKFSEVIQTAEKLGEKLEPKLQELFKLRNDAETHLKEYTDAFKKLWEKEYICALLDGMGRSIKLNV